MFVRTNSVNHAHVGAEWGKMPVEQECDLFDRAQAAPSSLEEPNRERRLQGLETIADSLEAATKLVGSTARETGIDRQFRGRLCHSTVQRRLFADALHKGGCVEADIDEASGKHSGPRSYLRRTLQPFAWQNAPELVSVDKLRNFYGPIPRWTESRLVLSLASGGAR